MNIAKKNIILDTGNLNDKVTHVNNSRVTLQDIANKLDCTKVTVSKALRNHPDISKETTELIKKTAQEMGYYPNIAARNLTSKTTNTIGVIVPVIANTFFASTIDAIYDYAYQKNYEIVLAVSHENSEKEKKHLETMLSMHVDGIIISVSEHSQNLDLFEKIKLMNVPLVFFDRITEIENCDTVTLNNELGSFLAVEHAIKNGYKKIGFLAGYDDINIGRDRMKGFKNALEHYDIKLNNDWIVNCGYSRRDGYEGFMKLYNSGNLPEFLFTVTFPVAMGIYSAAKELNLSIPNDFDMISFGNSEMAKYLTPALSCVDPEPETTGKEAIDLIIRSIDKGKDHISEQLKIKPKLILRETCI